MSNLVITGHHDHLILLLQIVIFFDRMCWLNLSSTAALCSVIPVKIKQIIIIFTVTITKATILLNVIE